MKGCLSLIVILVFVAIVAAIFKAGSGHQETPAAATSVPVVQKPVTAVQTVTTNAPAAVVAPTPPPFPAMKFWPKTVHLVQAAEFTSESAGAAIKTKVPAGTAITGTLSTDEKTIAATWGQLKAQIPIEWTDFVSLARATEAKAIADAEQVRKADAARAEAEKAAAIQAKAQEAREYGPEPLFVETGLFGANIPPALERMVKKSMREPSSFKIRQLIGMKKAEHNGVKCYQLAFEYSAKNGFGGTSIGTVVAWVRGDEVLDIQNETN